IIVCGDQSSEKSSVLKAISDVSFPVKSNLSTRFPTKLVLRKTSQTSVSVSIVSHQARTEFERLALSSFHEQLENFEELSDLIEKAKATMRISVHDKAFSKDFLRVEVSSSDRPHLTIVDLPELIHSETKQQSAFDVELVQDVVQFYMKEPRSIILTMISTKNDYANQIVLKLARAADKKSNRTLSVITKSDTLLADSESEAIRLSKILLEQIAAELPSLIDEIEVKSSACRSRLDKLGDPRATLAEQQLYLFHLSQAFQSLVKAAVDGTYNDPFFDDPKSGPGYQKRIRAVVQNLNLEFADKIAAREFLGHAAAYVADATTFKALFQKIFEPALNQLLESLSDKTTELLTPHQRSHPITYNHYFTETLQKLRNERNQNEYSKIVKQFFGVSSLETHHYCRGNHDLYQLVTTLVQRTEPDMNRFACSEALDCMEAYYKVALKRFIDDMAVEVIEAKLISPISSIFTPVAVSAMSADLVTSMADEFEENRAQREQLIKQLEVLMKGSDICKRFIGVRLLSADGDAPQSDPEFNDDSASDGSIDFDKASKLTFEGDTRSSTDGSVRPRRLSIERSEPVIKEKTPLSASDLVTKTLESEFVELGLGTSKKSKKKSKVSAARSVFEED
ncbi:MAG: hypothetical protein Q9191_003922, partial [Dirinaria sp. TL-2023a]